MRKKSKRDITNRELVDYVCKKFRLDRFWAYWLVRAIDITCERDSITIDEFSKSKKLRYFIDGFIAAVSMMDVIKEGESSRKN